MKFFLNTVLLSLSFVLNAQASPQLCSIGPDVSGSGACGVFIGSSQWKVFTSLDQAQQGLISLEEGGQCFVIPGAQPTCGVSVAPVAPRAEIPCPIVISRDGTRLGYSQSCVVPLINQHGSSAYSAYGCSNFQTADRLVAYDVACINGVFAQLNQVQASVISPREAGCQVRTNYDGSLQGYDGNCLTSLVDREKSKNPNIANAMDCNFFQDLHHQGAYDVSCVDAIFSN